MVEINDAIYQTTWELNELELNVFTKWLATEEGRQFDDKITEIEQQYGHQVVGGW